MARHGKSRGGRKPAPRQAKSASPKRQPKGRIAGAGATRKKQAKAASKSDEHPNLKPRVALALDGGGAYVLFNNREMNGQAADRRKEAIRQQLRQAGKKYWKSATIEVFGRDRISSWVNEHIAAAAFVMECVGKTVPIGFMTWKRWKDYAPNSFAFVSDATIESRLREIRERLVTPKTVVRVLGVSGFGKTRTVLEALAPPTQPDAQQEMLNRCVLYVNAAKTPANQILEQAQYWSRDQRRGVVVVDECDLPLHKSLVAEVRHKDSALSLITLDFQPETTSSEWHTIRLERASSDVITNIIKQSYPNLPDRDIHRIVTYAQGYPRMAVLLANAQLSGQDFWSITDSDLTEKLVWGRDEPDPDALEALSICALFGRLGFFERAAPERNFVAHYFGHHDDPEQFYRVAARFFRNDTLYRRGDFVRVTPAPLALQLAADWWRKCSPERALELVTLDEMPEALREALFDQLKELGTLPEAQRLVEHLSSATGPFGRAATLETELGSRLLRSLAEINPPAVARTLMREFGTLTTEEFRELEDARRNLVWTLEKLAWWKETFHEAAWLMAALAAAETETFGNNATNQFRQLFHLYLSGTQATPDDRLKVADVLLADEDFERRAIALKALGSALTTHHFMRMGGVEAQGGRPAGNEWQPTTGRDILDYWRGCLSRLARYASDDSPLGIVAREQLVEHMSGMLSQGLVDEVAGAVRAIPASAWPEGLHALRSARGFLTNLNAEDKTKIDSLIASLWPTDFVSRVRLILGQDSRGVPKLDASGMLTDEAKQEAIDLARDIASDPAELLANIRIIYEGKLPGAYHFGLTLAKELKDMDRFCRLSLDVLPTIPKAERSLAALAGALRGVEPRARQQADSVLDEVAASTELNTYLIGLTTALTLQQRDLDRALEAVEGGKIPLDHLSAFGYGPSLSTLSPPSFVRFAERIAAINNEDAPIIALDLTLFFAHLDPANFTQTAPLMKKMLTRTGILSNGKLPRRLSGHYLVGVVQRLLEAGDAEDLAVTLAREAIDYCNQAKGFDDSMEPLLRVLLTKAGATVWPLLASELLRKRSDRTWLLERLMAHMDSFGSRDGLIELVPKERLLAWADSTPEAARVLARLIVPLNRHAGAGQDPWTDVAREVLDRYGSDPAVLRGISTQVHTFGWVGSAVPTYEVHERAFAALSTHRHAQVRDWASRELEAARERVRIERKRDEEGEFER